MDQFNLIATAFLLLIVIKTDFYYYQSQYYLPIFRFFFRLKLLWCICYENHMKHWICHVDL